MKNHSNCPLCNAATISDNKWLYCSELLLCSQCGLVFDKRVPSEQELTDHYNTYSYSGRKPLSVATKLSFEKLLDYFEPFRKNSNILDVGCGQGDFLIAARERGWNVYGSEYSPAAIKLCEDAGITMWPGEFSGDSFGDVKFDCVTSFEVLEHVNQPKKLIYNSISPLRAGGLFYLTTPNFNSIMRYFERKNFRILGYPEHLAFYTKKSIRLLLSQYDLVEKKVLTTGIDISRIKDLFRKVEQQKTSRVQSMTENNIVRERLSSGKGRYLKNIANYVLTISGTGDTLKAYYLKK
ncbi:class I SAM-dependent methyltransferase [Candidatus Electrothrix sp.]|uniref:class I SAM-dependent methyltransferase n=1 Tax=Candidatus Electrothrix sp. TaxID=2170559 RepID=UPI0040563166